MNALIALITLSLFSQPLANAADLCPTIDLDQSEPALQNLPVWDQGSNPSCYVYSAGFLATVWMRENWGQVNASFLNYTTDPAADYQAILRDTAASPRIMDAENGRTCESFEYILQTEKNQVGPKNPLMTIPGCSMWGIDLNADGTHKVQQTPQAFEAKMHELLTASNQPLPFAIEYCSAIFYDPAGTFITNRVFRPTLTYLNEAGSDENLSDDCGFHSSAVIGQKMENGVCYFKIRNSWGTSSAGNPNIANGNYWVPAESLSRNTLRIIEVTP